MQDVTNADVRTWAVNEGLKVGVRGRLPKPVLTQYLGAHPKFAREVAAEKGISVPAKGKLSASALDSILTTPMPDAKP
jgi:hypothetical protein